MLRSIYCFAFLLLAHAVPVKDDQRAKVLSYVNESDGKGNYNFRFETSNGIIRDETGLVTHEGQPDQYIYVIGFISFLDSEGKRIEFRYTADKSGYKISPSDDSSQVILENGPNLVASLIG